MVGRKRVQRTPIRVRLGGLYPSRGGAKGLLVFRPRLLSAGKMASQAGPFRAGLPLREPQDSWAEADAGIMFRRSSEPLPLSEASLLALRPALNAPVLNVKFLPVGPAKAAIVVFAEEYGGIGLAIGVRSNEGGQVIVFRNQQPIDASVPVSDAIESALSSAERMGFLFDEDMVESIPGGQGRSRAMALWGDLMGELEMPSSPETAAAQSAASDVILESDSGSAFNTSIIPEPVAELVLDDVAAAEPAEISLDLEADLEPLADFDDLELDLEELSMGESAETTERVMPEEPHVDVPPAPIPPEQQLSKFRSVPIDPDSADQADGSALGRIPIVRVRREGSKRVPYLARLLSSF